MEEKSVKLWHTFFIVTFVLVYGTLSLALVGSLALEAARSFAGATRPAGGRLRKRGSLVGATVLVSMVAGLWTILAFRGLL
jgi:hypothetical protein